MALAMSSLCNKLDATDKLLECKCIVIVGDNAYVKKKHMSSPLKCIVGEHDDAYNFYMNQLRITIERCFGVLVHRCNLVSPTNMTTSKCGNFTYVIVLVA